MGARRAEPGRTSLADRFGVALANLALALPTAVLLWTLLNGWPWDWLGWLPAWTILAFTGVMTLLGALMQQNLLLSLYEHTWSFIVAWFRN